jgi:hypothetical protein
VCQDIAKTHYQNTEKYNYGMGPSEEIKISNLIGVMASEVATRVWSKDSTNGLTL